MYVIVLVSALGEISVPSLIKFKPYFLSKNKYEMHILGMVCKMLIASK